MTPKLIESHFPVKACPKCGKPIEAGARVWYDADAPRGKKSWHEACGANQQQQAQQAQQQAQETTAGQQATQHTTEAATIAPSGRYTVTQEAHNTTIYHFDSTQALALECNDYIKGRRKCKRASPAYLRENGNSSWAGETADEAVNHALFGHDALVTGAAEFMDKMRRDLPEAMRPEWTPSVYGAYPNVPDYLAGAPDSMRRRVHVQTDRAPITIYVDATSSGGIDFRDMERRGAAILALVMLAVEQRPVDLYVCAGLNKDSKGASIVTCKVPVQPLELATVAHAFAGTGFARVLCYGFIMDVQDPSCGGGWEWDIIPTEAQDSDYYRRMMEVHHCDPRTTIYVPPPVSGDTLLQDPAAWVKAKLDKLGALNDEEGQLLAA